MSERNINNLNPERIQMRNKHFKTVLENADVGFTIFDIHQSRAPFIFVNDAFLQMTGYTRCEVMGQNYAMFYGPETHSKTLARIDKALGEKNPITIDVLYYRKNGSKFWNECHLYPVFDNSTLMAFVGLHKDIDRVVKAHDSFKSVINDQEAKIAATYEFFEKILKDVQDQVDDMVSATLAFEDNEAIKKTTKKTSKNNPSLFSNILNKGKKLQSILNDLMDLSYMSTGHIYLKPKPCYLQNIIDDVGADINKRAETKNIAFILKANALPSRAVLTDGHRFSQMLKNLAYNALESTKEGHVYLSIACKDISHCTLSFCVTIADTGQHKYELYQDTDLKNCQCLKNQLFDQQTLGLKLSKQIIDAMNGEINVDIKPTQGRILSIDFTFPFASEFTGKKNSQQDTYGKKILQLR